MHEMQIGAGWFGLIQHLNEIPGQARNDGGFYLPPPYPVTAGRPQDDEAVSSAQLQIASLCSQ